MSASDHGTLWYFKSLLRCTTVTSDVKKAVDANVEFLMTVFKGHILAKACKILEISTLDDSIPLPLTLTHSTASKNQQFKFVKNIASKIVKKCTLINTCTEIDESDDKVYNYAKVLCHFGAIITEMRDAWAEGDGDCTYRCWHLMLPHFKSSGRTKYSLESLRLQFQVKSCMCSQQAHQVVWDRFVNVKGGAGRNIPCDLYNEHIAKLIKTIVTNMGPNLTEKSLQRAAQSVSTLDLVCKQFDSESNMPVITSRHSTKTDLIDIQKVVSAVLSNNLLSKITGRKHNMYKTMRLNPLWNWNREETIEWIEKKKEFQKYRGIDAADVPNEEEETENEYFDL